MKKLEKLLDNLGEYTVLQSSFTGEVTGVSYDSRRVKPGFLFTAIQGFRQDGHNFINSALDNGAKIIVVEKEVPLTPGVTYLKVKNSREAMSKLSEAFYDFPSRKMQLVGVTGTNGKTTTTYMVEAIMRAAGYKTGLIGTISNKIGDNIFSTERTTPESADLQELFAQMVDNGVSHAVMEVSSHALELKRVMDLVYKIGIFTNLTQDHLDFHNSLENYRAAKGKLFNILMPDGVAIINVDDPSGEYMIKQCQGKFYTYAIHHEADIKASDVNVGVNGVQYVLTTPQGKVSIRLNLTGHFNVYNSLGAIGAGIALGIPLNVIKAGLESLTEVSGRFQQVNIGQNFGVIIDYAHTPDGMENVLKTACGFVQGRKLVVFGAGGDRDRTKRPIMGRIAAEYGDVCFLTSDNPRTEDPMQILHDIKKGFESLNRLIDYQIIPDRREAIFAAVREAKPGDLVLILGKGHETYQIFKDRTVHFDDREVAEEAIKSL